MSTPQQNPNGPTFVAGCKHLVPADLDGNFPLPCGPTLAAGAAQGLCLQCPQRTERHDEHLRALPAEPEKVAEPVTGAAAVVPVAAAAPAAAFADLDLGEFADAYAKAYGIDLPPPRAAVPEPEPEPPPADPLPSAPVRPAPYGLPPALLSDEVPATDCPPVASLWPQDAPTGPSPMGSTSVRTSRQCLRRYFYEVVLGIGPARSGEHGEYGSLDPLELGSMVHELLRQRYLGLPWVETVEAVAPHYPKLAEEAYRLVEQHEAHYQSADQETWDVRGAEVPVYVPLKKKRIKSLKKSLQLTLTARLDLVVRKMGPDDPRLPPGEAADRLVLINHKTAAQVTSAIGRSYQHDPQVLHEFGVFRDGFVGGLGLRAAEYFGHPHTYVINVIGKAKDHDPQKHLTRPSIVPIADVITEYMETTAYWVQTELAERLFHPQALDSSTWPKGWACRDPVRGVACPYMPACELNASTNAACTMFPQVREPLDTNALLAPPPVKRKTRRKKTTGPDQK